MKEMSKQYLESKRHGNHLERIAAMIIDNGDIDGAHHRKSRRRHPASAG